ncbi:FkbM family methyltransferase [Enterobacter asburiae]|uniref:FkbM family methyltransferase n=1 Tax=Enterobacter asburiae TaxID=61645 RepID=UPI00287A02E1|nr:FkbM family methyltransferase [Enterobacter asburiae]MDS1916330.1 FkbM family methyltransferase [Enterobacter asburiae]
MPENIVEFHRCGNLNYLLTNGPDLISNYLREGKVWEAITLKVSQLLIDQIDKPVLIDIGANLGAWSVPMGSYVKERGGVVHAFEPQRPVFYQLCSNFLANDLMNCFANNMAIGDFTGYIDIPLLDIFRSKNVGALSLSEKIRHMQGWNINVNKKEKVRIITLDELQLPSANLIKIDVEGLELEVLKGGKNWIRQSGNPPIIFEVWGDSMKGMLDKKKKLFTFLQDEMKYELYLNGELCIAQHSEDSFIALEECFRKILRNA